MEDKKVISNENLPIARPTILYHASWNINITEFEPRAESKRDVKEGPVVFATPNKILAAIFLVPTDDSWVASGFFSSGAPYIAISDRERFTKLDQGGAIYELPSVGFECDFTKGLRENEWTNKRPVRPIGQENY